MGRGRAVGAREARGGRKGGKEETKRRGIDRQEGKGRGREAGMTIAVTRCCRSTLLRAVAEHVIENRHREAGIQTDRQQAEAGGSDDDDDDDDDGDLDSIIDPRTCS
eukprot:475315-Rhodomonas_salina.2